MSDDLNCLACGARLAEDALACDLCGIPRGMTDEDPIYDEEIPAAPAGKVGGQEPVDNTSPAHRGEPSARAVYCIACGFQNPMGANFCAQCGKALVSLSAPRAIAPVRGSELPRVAALSNPAVAASVPSPRSDAASIGSPGGGPASAGAPPSPKSLAVQVGVIVGAGILLVVAVFLIRGFLQPQTIPGPQPRAQASGIVGSAAVEEPLTDTLQERITDLRSRAASAETDVEVIGLQQQIVDVAMGEGRYDVASYAMEAIATRTDTENDWARAGNFAFDWMMDKPDPSQRAAWAVRTIGFYQRALDINPSNLDVRTDMAIAYMYDPQNPMEAVNQTNLVLEADSLHIQANFNLGIMLFQINRPDRAASQFQKVMDIIADPSDDTYQRAQDLFNQVNASAS
jgi:ribosomal protein L40E